MGVPAQLGAPIWLLASVIRHPSLAKAHGDRRSRDDPRVCEAGQNYFFFAAFFLVAFFAAFFFLAAMVLSP
jgi:hypothetical protein